ncbi:MAG: HU family DNA-binding protein [Bacilli bacterium]|jgi:nucleoid DNA-binding protein
MNKTDLIKKVSFNLNKTQKETAEIINETFATIAEVLEKGEKVVISNFGTFKVIETKPFECFNPINGEKMQIASQRRIRFNSSR